MTYNTNLPHIDNMLWLRRLARPFPVSAGRILEIAKAWNFSSNTIDLLILFPEDEIFESESDFLARCQELELLIREKEKMPAEILRSPQD